MKQKILTLLFIGIVPIYSFSQQAGLSAAHIEKYTETAKETFLNFYSKISLLVDNDPSLEDAKFDLLLEIQENFDNYKSLIKNDMHILGMSMEIYQIDEYLKNLKNSNGNENNRFIEIDADNITAPIKLYKETKSNRYYSFIFYTRKVTLSEKSEDEEHISKPVTDEKNMLMSIYTTNGKNYYIDRFGLAPAAYNPLNNGYTLVTPVTQEAGEQQITKGIPYFIFDIQPKNAILYIDDVEYDYINGEKLPTTVGRHSIKIAAPNYVTKMLISNVENVGIKKMNVSLEKAKGKLLVKSNAPHASLEITNLKNKNENYKTDVSGNVVELMPGSYKIVITAPDYMKHTENITIHSGLTTPLSVIQKSVEERKEERQEKVSKMKSGLKSGVGILNSFFGTNIPSSLTELLNPSTSETDNNNNSSSNEKESQEKTSTTNSSTSIADDISGYYYGIWKNSTEEEKVKVSIIGSTVEIQMFNVLNPLIITGTIKPPNSIFTYYQLNIDKKYIAEIESNSTVFSNLTYEGFGRYYPQKNTIELTIKYKSGTQTYNGTTTNLTGKASIGTFKK